MEGEHHGEACAERRREVKERREERGRRERERERE